MKPVDLRVRMQNLFNTGRVKKRYNNADDIQVLIAAYNQYLVRDSLRLPCEHWAMQPNGHILLTKNCPDDNILWMVQFFSQLHDWSCDQRYRVSGALRTSSNFSLMGKIIDCMIDMGLVDLEWNGTRLINQDGKDVTHDPDLHEVLEIVRIREDDIQEGHALLMYELPDFVVALAWRAIFVEIVEGLTAQEKKQ